MEAANIYAQILCEIVHSLQRLILIEESRSLPVCLTCLRDVIVVGLHGHTN